ncbi:hypothetical protein AVEN_273677-1 [Araneus ventricosus]|uniref:DUF4817 domain-containing protein n=1 Tax=Araneus ventricosus TaxID=182803 RepID=A0A4Y2PPM0_ARAVE|nr:hypothetical protein AVEN_273677-1 [Araneus ventricosus]
MAVVEKRRYANLGRFKRPVVSAVKSFSTMLKERALLIKLFYQNGYDLPTSLRVYRRLKGLRKGIMSRQALEKDEYQIGRDWGSGCAAKKRTKTSIT